MPRESYIIKKDARFEEGDLYYGLNHYSLERF